jgi:hypothetical protein
MLCISLQGSIPGQDNDLFDRNVYIMIIDGELTEANDEQII